MTDHIGARVLLIDIESSPILGYSWKKWDTSIIHIVDDWHLMSVAWKWLHQRKTNVLATDTVTEKKLTKTIWQLFDDADIVVGHNGDRFDIKKLQAKMKEFDLKPPSPFKSVDTLKIARNHFAFSSNKLDDLGQKLKLGQKTDTGGFKLWLDCMAGDQKAWDKMKAYNKQDVVLLEKLYLELRAWTPRHPNIATYMECERVACAACGSENVQARGYYHTNTGSYKRFMCKDCGTWSRGRKSTPFVKVSAIVCDRK